MRTLALAWRMLLRDARAGELRLLLAALILAVGALTAVGFFTDRVSRALKQEANQMMGADLLLIADHPWQDNYVSLAQQQGLRTAHTQIFPSMVTGGDATQLADIKAVSDGYPLRGHVRISMALGGAEETASDVPRPGTVWVDERLATTLRLKIGDTVQVGQRGLKVAAYLMLEPDRGLNFFSLAPRLMMHRDDVKSTELIQVGSRVNYRLLLAGNPEQIERYQATVKSRLGRGERIEDTSNGRPEMRQALGRAQSFLGLAALLSVVLSAVAIAFASRRYVARHLDGCAVMRCLGAQQRRLLQLYLLQFFVLSLIGMVGGCLLGYAAHHALYVLLAPLLNTTLPEPSLLPVLQGMTVSLLLFGFAVPQLMQLHRVPTMRVLRRELDVTPVHLLRGYALCGALLICLMLWVAGEIKLGLYVVGGFAAALALFSLLAMLGLRLLARWRGHRSFALRHALLGLTRHRNATIVQIVALALGFMAILLLTVTHGQLLDAWRKATPPDAPNRFVINIQPDQMAEVEDHFRRAGLSAPLSPMVRGRLMRVNERPVGAADYEEERAQRLVEREFNLSWRAGLPEGNRIEAGRWFDGKRLDEASVEDGLAKTLKLELGDKLDFDIAGTTVTMRITSLRKLDWDSMRVNFFVLTPPGVLDQHPQSLITSFHLPETQGAFVPALIERFPNLTVIDVGAILRQLREVIGQVAQAMRFVFVFTLLCGVLVLYAALANGLDARRREQAVMRALGATSAPLRRALQLEFAFVGALAGFIAALASLAVGEVLASQVFNFEMPLTWWLPFPAAVAGAVLVPLAATFATREILALSPVEALREA